MSGGGAGKGGGGAKGKAGGGGAAGQVDKILKEAASGSTIAISTPDERQAIYNKMLTQNEAGIKNTLDKAFGPHKRYGNYKIQFGETKLREFNSQMGIRAKGDFKTDRRRDGWLGRIAKEIKTEHGGWNVTDGKGVKLL